MSTDRMRLYWDEAARTETIADTVLTTHGVREAVTRNPGEFWAWMRAQKPSA